MLPSEFEPHLRRTDKPRKVKLTVVRPKAAAEQAAPAQKKPKTK